MIYAEELCNLYSSARLIRARKSIWMKHAGHVGRMKEIKEICTEFW
jgi:hypothetical protein